jgi:hypothetical protein
MISLCKYDNEYIGVMIYKLSNISDSMLWTCCWITYDLLINDNSQTYKKIKEKSGNNSDSDDSDDDNDDLSNNNIFINDE